MKTFAALLLLVAPVARAQVGVGTRTPHPSAALEVASPTANQGLLPPRLTTAQRAAISSPAAGLLIFNTTTGCLEVYNGTGWQSLCGAGAAAGFGRGSLNCAGPLAGAYAPGTALTAANTKQVNVTVSSAGPWTASTDQQNGVSFAGQGTLAPGEASLMLTASGMPAGSGTFNYTLSSPSLPAGETCTFTVSYPSNAVGFTGFDCNPGAAARGTYTVGRPVTNGRKFMAVSVSTPGAYSFTTNTVNGLYFAASGTFTGTGWQGLDLQAVGTPQAAVPATYTLALAAGNTCSFTLAAPAPAPTTYTNPLVSGGGPDPWVLQKDGYYYYLATNNQNVTITRTERMSEVSSGQWATVWTKPATGLNSSSLWAPELHFLDGKWYVYYTAGAGADGYLHLRVLENAGPDPLIGTWTDKGQIIIPNGDMWAIDGTVFEQNGNRYLVWSGREGDPTRISQRIYIGQLSNPWTLTGSYTELSRPQYPWEAQKWDVNEGPEIIQHGSKTFLTFSGSSYCHDGYSLGLLWCTRTADPLLAASWTKLPNPVFSQLASSNVYGPGHNGFFTSRDGSENWLIYHARVQPNLDCPGNRYPMMQKFTWDASGLPVFGQPVPTNTPLPRPAGE
ncbi:hypothetical protein EJV47_10375 [Hymenobacter gummosus]|uniref:Glycosyl hydrolase family 43 n=1 Tax=Hymenobacter gummosus TaxID=1776032 RepID=A0A431U353_9BACT|nr:glycoside hydrolase family 43 protein [Hymenobacter gummosus]RTQ50039.1 hypothetical protein EJV47_10375 [Hymenobacter gummosus]